MLTPNEIRLHSGVSGWAVNPDTGAVVYLHRRSPSSTDLMLLADGRLSTLEEGISIIGRPVWTDRQLVYQSGHQLLRLSPLSPDPQSPEVLFEIDSAAAFVESPVRFNGDSLLFVLKGQSVPRLMKLVDGTATCVLVGPRGSRFVSYAAHGDQIVVALAFAEAMTAHVQVQRSPGADWTVLAVERRAEYSPPCVGIAADGRVIAKLNLLREDGNIHHDLWVLSEGAQDRLPGSPDGVEQYAGDFVLSACGSHVCVPRRTCDDSVTDTLCRYAPDGTASTYPSSEGKAQVQVVAATATRAWVVRRTPDSWGDLYVCDMSGPSGPCATTRLTHTMPHALRRKLQPLPEERWIETAGGGRMHCLVYVPPSPSTRRPSPSAPPVAADPTHREPAGALVWVHGGPMVQVRWDYYPVYHWLASQGFVVVVPNFRGSTGFGVPHMDAVMGDGVGRADVDDVAGVAAVLRADPGRLVDTGRVPLDLSRGIGVAGRSWGGYVALMLACTRPHVFSAYVAGSAIADWAVQQRHTEVRYYDHWLLGGWAYEAEAGARAVARSPVTHAGDVRGPLLVYHGDKDNDVPFAQLPPFVERVKAAGADVEFVVYEGEGHSNRDPENQRDVLQRIETFLRVNLKPWDFVSNPHGDVTAY